MKRLAHFTWIINFALSFAITQPVAAKDAATVEKPAEVLKPVFDESSPGVGPLRSEPAFVKLWNDRRAYFARKNEKQQHAIVFFGDSITQGWSEDFRGKFPGLKVTNRGISGDTTRGLLARVDKDVLSLNPSAVVILIGTNDIGLKVPTEGIANNIKLLIDKITAHDPNTPIILCQVMPSQEIMRRPSAQIRDLNERVAAIVRGNKRVTLIDTFTLFANEKGDAKLEEFPDLLHPNDVGYDKWKAALMPVFATLGLVEKEADAFKPEEDFELIFNGHDLNGWGYPKTTEKDVAMVKQWREAGKTNPAYPIVESPISFDHKTESTDARFRAINGRLVVTTPTEGRCVQELATTHDFPGDFTLKLDFRATPNADSGVFIRGRQLQCRDYTLAGPKEYKNLKHYKPQDWNELVIEVKGNKARCTCNGELLEAAYELPATGPIGVEGDRGQMEYRHIRIRKD